MIDHDGTDPGETTGNPNENWIPEVANEPEEQETDWVEPHGHEHEGEARNWVPDVANDPKQQEQHTDWVEPHEDGDKS